MAQQVREKQHYLCLNYDGKFGLNNINNYFQNANSSKEAVYWKEWSYKEGDPILFNDTARFSLLYNNLKGRIIKIDKESDRISFTIDVDVVLTERDCKREEIELIDNKENSTRIRFTVYAYNDEKNDGDDELRMKSIIPFQLAYAVSIHKEGHFYINEGTNGCSGGFCLIVCTRRQKSVIITETRWEFS